MGQPNPWTTLISAALKCLAVNSYTISQVEQFGSRPPLASVDKRVNIASQTPSPECLARKTRPVFDDDRRKDWTGPSCQAFFAPVVVKHRTQLTSSNRGVSLRCSDVAATVSTCIHMAHYTLVRLRLICL